MSQEEIKALIIANGRKLFMAEMEGRKQTAFRARQTGLFKDLIQEEANHERRVTEALNA